MCKLKYSLSSQDVSAWNTVCELTHTCLQNWTVNNSTFCSGEGSNRNNHKLICIYAREVVLAILKEILLPIITHF